MSQSPIKRGNVSDLWQPGMTHCRCVSQSPIKRGNVSDADGDAELVADIKSQSPIKRGNVSDLARAVGAPDSSCLNPLSSGAMFLTPSATASKGFGGAGLNPLSSGAMFLTPG